jgi:hypothetical protein
MAGAAGGAKARLIADERDRLQPDAKQARDALAA